VDQEPLGRRLEVSDGVEPSGNASMISLLERLSALTGRAELEDAAVKALRVYAAMIRRRGLDMAGWLDGALLHEGPFYELVVAGEQGPLWETWNRLLPPWTVGALVPPNGPSPELEKAMPIASEKKASRNAAIAYVCVRGSCKAPASNATKLRASLLQGWER
jgi:uncharacterized protein YyaL (SSP411 family)